MPATPVLYMSPGSHHSRRVVLLVHELALDVELRAIEVRPRGMGGENESADYLKLNPLGKVPLLEDGDYVLTESNAIMAYLCERHGFNPLWPADIADRAQVLKWQFLQAAQLSPAADGLLYENLVKPMVGEPPDAAAAARFTQAFHRCAAAFDAVLEREDYLVGGRITCADLSAATALMYAGPARIPIGEHPPLMAWLDRVKTRPSWIATEPPPMAS